MCVCLCLCAVDTHLHRAAMVLHSSSSGGCVLKYCSIAMASSGATSSNTTVFTSFVPRLYMMADPYSWHCRGSKEGRLGGWVCVKCIGIGRGNFGCVLERKFEECWKGNGGRNNVGLRI